MKRSGSTGLDEGKVEEGLSVGREGKRNPEHKAVPEDPQGGMLMIAPVSPAEFFDSAT